MIDFSRMNSSMIFFLSFDRFGFYADPFDIHLFDVDLSTLIECSLRQRNPKSSSLSSSNSTSIPQSSRPLGINDNAYDPRIYSRYGTTGLPIIPTDPDSLYSTSNIQYALSKLLPNSLSSSNVYLKPIPGLFEVTPLNYTMHSSSDGTRLERVDMTHLLTLRTYESNNAPPPPNVTLTSGAHHLYHPSTSSSLSPPPLPPSMSGLNSAIAYPFSFPTPNINNYYDTFYMLPPTTNSSTGTTSTATNEATGTAAVSSYSVSNALVSSSINGNSMNPPWFPHLSKFKDKQGLQKEKLKLIAKKNKAATAQSSMLKKNSALFNDLIHSSKSSSTTTIHNPQSYSSHSNTSIGKTRMEDEQLDRICPPSPTTIDDLLTQISNNILHGQYLPLYQFIIDRLSSGGRSYFVLDFGQQVTLTDILFPSCPELASLSLDFWSHGEHIDCQRLFSSTHIATQPFFLHDLQPTIIARYLRITLIGQSNISVSSIRLPVGYFFGYPYILNDENETIDGNHFETYRKKFQQIEGIYESLISTYALCRQKLFNLLSSPNNIERTYLEKIYRECIQLQIQINQANRQIHHCKQWLKVDSFERTSTSSQASSDYLKLLVDLLTSELTVLSGMNSSSFISLEQALQIFDTFAIRHVQITDMPKRLLQLCSYHSWWPEFVKKCLEHYFVSNEILSNDQKQSLFIHLIDLCEQTLLTPNSPTESTSSYNRLLAIEYVNKIYELILTSNENCQTIEWLLLFLYRLSEKNLFPYFYEQTQKKNHFSQSINKHWQFLHTSSIIPSPRLIHPTNNYRRKIRKETLLKKSTKSSSSSLVTTQPSTSTILISPSNAIDCFCHRTLTLQVCQYLMKLLLDKCQLSKEFFLLICKSLTDISRSTKPLIFLNEFLSEENFLELMLKNDQVWLKHAWNYFLIDLIDNENWLLNQIHDEHDEEDDDEIEIDDEKEFPEKKHFPAFKKSKKKIHSQQMLVQFQNEQDLLYPPNDDFLILLAQSPYHQTSSSSSSTNSSHNSEIIPFSIDNRLDGNIQIIFDLFTINQSYKIQHLLNQNFILNYEYQLKSKDSYSNQHERIQFFLPSTSDMLNKIFQKLLYQSIDIQSSMFSYECFNQIEHLLSSYLMISLANYSKNLPSKSTHVHGNQPPMNLNLKPLFFMSIEILDRFLRFLLDSSLITRRLWHHVFSLLYYTSTNVQLANQMKEKWFQGDVENSLFAQIWLKFLQTTQDMIDESTVDVIINYFERLFMCDNDNSSTNVKSNKRTATSGQFWLRKENLRLICLIICR